MLEPDVVTVPPVAVRSAVGYETITTPLPPSPQLPEAFPPPPAPPPVPLVPHDEDVLLEPP